MPHPSTASASPGEASTRQKEHGTARGTARSKKKDHHSSGSSSHVTHTVPRAAVLNGTGSSSASHPVVSLRTKDGLSKRRPGSPAPASSRENAPASTARSAVTQSSTMSSAETGHGGGRSGKHNKKTTARSSPDGGAAGSPKAHERTLDPLPAIVEYEGDTNAQGEPEGRGFARFSSGDEYEGEWVAGMREGKGSCTFATGEFYDGDWVAGRREGVGSTRYESGDKYEGEWKLGQREGKGGASGVETRYAKAK